MRRRDVQMSEDIHEIESEIRYLTTAEGGRKTGVTSGYRGQFHYEGDDHLDDGGDLEALQMGRCGSGALLCVGIDCDRTTTENVF
jgi:hypothetical protein